MIFWAYVALAALVALLCTDRQARYCGFIILGGLIATKIVTHTMDGVQQFALWGSIWSLCAVPCYRKLVCAALLLSAGVCYLIVYLAAGQVGPGYIASIVIDGAGIAALLVLGGQDFGSFVSTRLGRFHRRSALGRN